MVLIFNDVRVFWLQFYDRLACIVLFCLSLDDDYTAVRLWGESVSWAYEQIHNKLISKYSKVTLRKRRQNKNLGGIVSSET